MKPRKPRYDPALAIRPLQKAQVAFFWAMKSLNEALPHLTTFNETREALEIMLKLNDCHQDIRIMIKLMVEERELETKGKAHARKESPMK